MFFNLQLSNFPLKSILALMPWWSQMSLLDSSFKCESELSDWDVKSLFRLNAENSNYIHK
jgi:hypothetical protein